MRRFANLLAAIAGGVVLGGMAARAVPGAGTSAFLGGPCVLGAGCWTAGGAGPAASSGAGVVVRRLGPRPVAALAGGEPARSVGVRDVALGL